MIDQKLIGSIKRAFEKNLSEKVLELIYLDKGACNNIFYCETLSGLYTIKQERPDKLDTEANNLQTEARILRSLKYRKLEFMPQIIFQTNRPKLLCYKYINGRSLDLEWSFLSKKNRGEVMTQLGKIYALLHRSLSRDEQNSLGIPTNNKSILAYVKEYKVTLNKSYLQDDLLYKILARIKHEYKKNDYGNNFLGLLHGDAHQGNMLIHNNKLSGIVDFGACEIADVNKDFAHFARHYPKYLDIVIESYEKNSETKLNKKKIILWGILKDLEKIIYHVKKIKVGKERLRNKIKTYNTLLNNVR